MPQAQGFIGSGDVYLNPYDPDTGLPTGWMYGGDSDKFAIKPNSEIKERKSKARNGYGQVKATVALQAPADLAMTFSEVNGPNLTLAFMGKATDLNVAAGSVAAQAVTFKKAGTGAVGVKLAHGNVKEAGFALKNGATTYVKDTDYTVNWRLGLVLPVAGGALAAAILADADGSLACTVAYDHGAIGGTKISGAVQAQLRTAVMLDGKNQVDGTPCICEVWDAILTPEGEFDFLADDWNDVQLKGRMSTPTGKAEPFEVRLPTFA